MTKKLTIEVRRNHGNYAAHIREDGDDAELFFGNSPDEAIGNLIRGMWLSGELATPVLLDFDIKEW